MGACPCESLQDHHGGFLMLYVLRRWLGDDLPPINLITYKDREEAVEEMGILAQAFPLFTFDIWEGTEVDLRAQGVTH